MKKEIRQLICAGLFQNKKVLVLGLGKTGLSCVKFLAERYVHFAVMDSRAEPPGIQTLRNEYPDTATYLNGFKQDVINDFDVILVSPGISLQEPIVQYASAQGKVVIGDVEVFAQCTTKPVIAITGSNGKSTVTALLGLMAKIANINVAVGGNIGVPVLDLIGQDDNTDLYVLELSSFQLETTNSLNAAVSVILNVSEDHMDRYSCIEDYQAAKQKIFSGVGNIVVNDDAGLELDIEQNRKQTHYSLSTPGSEEAFGLLEFNGEIWLAKGKQKLLPVRNCLLKGQHNISNILAALALGDSVNISMTAMLEAIQKFNGLPHRTQFVAENKGVTWINDSKATNVGATIAAVTGLQSENLIVLLGGQGKGQDFSMLKPALQSACKLAIVFGQDAQAIEKVLDGYVKYQHVDDFQAAIDLANQISVANDIVLLSPACASFDMFNGFEHRGDEFIRLVNEVIA